MLDAGLANAQALQARSEQMQGDYDNIYKPIETGILPPGATRSTGYYAPSMFENKPEPTAEQIIEAVVQEAEEEEEQAEGTESQPPSSHPPFLPRGGD